jgi:hypothetical protein
VLRDAHVGAIIIAKLIVGGLESLLGVGQHWLLWMIVSFAKWTVVFGRFDDVAPIPAFHPNLLQFAHWMLQLPVCFGLAYLFAGWVYAPAKKRRLYSKQKHRGREETIA